MLDYSVLPTANRTVVDEVIRRFYDEERLILSVSLRRGKAMGLFREIDPEVTATLVSTHLDGIMVRSMIHREFDIPRAIQEFEDLFWDHLGCSPVNDSFGPKPRKLAGVESQRNGERRRARNGRQLR